MTESFTSVNIDSGFSFQAYKYAHQIVNTVQVLIRSLGRLDGIAYPKINATLLMYDPILQASFHVTPIKGQLGEIPGIGSPFYQKIIGTLEAPTVPWVGGKRAILSDNEIRTLFHFSISLPHVSEAISYLAESTDIPHKLGLNSPISVSDRPKILLELLRVYSEPNTATIRALSGIPAHQIPVIHALLSAIPQFDEVRYAKLNRNKATPSASKPEEKLNLLENMARDFKTNGNFPFRFRLFLLLSLIESLRWEEDSWFYVIPNMYKYFTAEALAIQDALGLNFICLYLSGPDVKQFLQDTISTRSSKEKAPVAFRNELLAYSAQWADFAVESKHDKCVNQHMFFSELRENVTLAVSRALLSYFEPQRLIFWQPQQKEERQAGMCLTAEKNEYFDTLDYDEQARQLLLTPWGRYKFSNVYIDNNHPLDGVQIRENTIQFPLQVPGEKYFLVRMEFASDAEANVVPEFQIRSLVLRLSRFFKYMRLDDQLGDWYCKAFGSLYHAFDKVRQAKREYKELRDGEISYLQRLSRKVPDVLGKNERLLIDLGVGYGRVETELFNTLTDDWKIIGIDLSQRLLNIAKATLAEKYKSRFLMERMDLRNLSLTSYEGKADIVLLLFSTFGCFASPDENEQLLKNAYNLLKPGGILLIEQYNPMLEHPWPQSSIKGPPETKTDMVVEHTEWHEQKSGEGLKLVIARESVKHEDHTHYFGHYFYYRKANGDTRLLQCDAYNLHLYHQSWFLARVAELQAVKDCSLFGDFHGTAYDPGVSRLLIVQVEKMSGGDVQVAEDMKKMALEYLRNSKSAIANVTKARDALGKSSYKYLCEPEISSLLDFLNMNLHLLDHANQDNIMRVLSTSEDDCARMALLAREGSAGNWQKDNLLLKTLSSLKTCLDQ